jgi:hypothetical protein
MWIPSILWASLAGSAAAPEKLPTVDGADEVDEPEVLLDDGEGQPDGASETEDAGIDGEVAADDPEPAAPHDGTEDEAVKPVTYRKSLAAPPAPPPTDSKTEVSTKRTGKTKFKRSGSRQRFAVEVKLGPYIPDVDRNYSGPGRGPYATVFGKTGSDGNATGDPKAAVMGSVGFEWQFIYLAGPMGLGFQTSFVRDKADALLANPAPGENVRSAADNTTFSVLPLALQLVYRFEYLADRFRVPLVPYAKAGLAYGFWWSKDGSGKIARNSKGDKGSGGTIGWQLNFGGMLRLDFIERATARSLDQQTGINHTYLFGEYQVSRIDGFGSKKSISIGDNTWFAGFAFEF